MRELFFHDFGDLSDELFGHVRELTVVMDKVDRGTAFYDSSEAG